MISLLVAMALTELAKAVLPANVSRALLTRGQATFAAEYLDTLVPATTTRY